MGEQVEVLEWVEGRTMAVFGDGDPIEQMASSFLLAILFWSSTFITAGASLAAALVFTFTFWWGVFRLIIEGPGD